MFSLHMHIRMSQMSARVSQYFETWNVIGEMIVNIYQSWKHVEKTVSCIPFFAPSFLISRYLARTVTWLFLVRLCSNFAHRLLNIHGPFIGSSACNLGMLNAKITIYLGKNFAYLGCFWSNCSQLLHMGYLKHAQNFGHRRQLKRTYESHALTSLMLLRVGFGLPD